MICCDIHLEYVLCNSGKGDCVQVVSRAGGVSVRQGVCQSGRGCVSGAEGTLQPLHL